MEFPWAKNLPHINFGSVRGMSTRKGNVVFLDHIIEEAGLVMHEQMKKKEDKYAAIEDPNTTSLEIGITGIKIQDMAAKRFVYFFYTPLLSLCEFRVQLPMLFLQNQQLSLQLGPHVIFRRRYTTLPPIHPCSTSLYRPQERTPPAPPSRIPNRCADPRSISTRTRDRIPSRHVSGSRQGCSEDPRTQRGGDICVQVDACDFFGVGSCCCQG